MDSLCFECGKEAHHNHHIVPKSLGGTHTVPLCLACHGKVHDRDFLLIKTLQTKGIAEARKNGVYKGRKPGTTKTNPERAKELSALGMTGTEIAQAMEVSLRTVFRYLREPTTIAQDAPRDHETVRPTS